MRDGGSHGQANEHHGRANRRSSDIPELHWNGSPLSVALRSLRPTTMPPFELSISGQRRMNGVRADYSVRAASILSFRVARGHRPNQRNRQSRRTRSHCRRTSARSFSTSGSWRTITTRCQATSIFDRLPHRRPERCRRQNGGPSQ